MSKPVYVSICNQKGGVGKSDFTMLLASEICYSHGFNVAVVDCDYPQHTSYKLRQREIDLVRSNEFYNRMANEQFNRLQRPVYPIIQSKPEEALDLIHSIVTTSEVVYDFIFFDLPGTVNNHGVIRILEQIDYFFVPIEASREVLESSLSFAAVINEVLKEKHLENHLHLFWNKVDNREKNVLYDEYNEGVIKQLGIPLLKTHFPLSSRFRKSMNTNGDRRFLISTIFPITPMSVRDSKIDAKSFANEITNIILKNNDGKEVVKS